MLLDYELNLWNKKTKYIAGVDEVGRGCLAGPFVSAAVILDIKHFKELLGNDVIINDVLYQKIPKPYRQIKDSKKISPKKRKELSDYIKEHAISYSVEVIEPANIDEWGISKCTQIAFFNSVKHLKTAADHVLTDAFKISAFPDTYQTNIIGGDNKSITIAAASIVAKVYRDELMVKLHGESDEYKKYAFDKHKGYGTREHLENISKFGICDLHRRSFHPISILV